MRYPPIIICRNFLWQFFHTVRPHLDLLDLARSIYKDVSHHGFRPQILASDKDIQTSALPTSLFFSHGRPSDVTTPLIFSRNSCRRSYPVFRSFEWGLWKTSRWQWWGFCLMRLLSRSGWSLGASWSLSVVDDGLARFLHCLRAMFPLLRPCSCYQLPRHH